MSCPVFFQHDDRDATRPFRSRQRGGFNSRDDWQREGRSGGYRDFDRRKLMSTLLS